MNGIEPRKIHYTDGQTIESSFSGGQKEKVEQLIESLYQGPLDHLMQRMEGLKEIRYQNDYAERPIVRLTKQDDSHEEISDLSEEAVVIIRQILALPTKPPQTQAERDAEKFLIESPTRGMPHRPTGEVPAFNSAYPSSVHAPAARAFRAPYVSSGWGARFGEALLHKLIPATPSVEDEESLPDSEEDTPPRLSPVMGPESPRSLGSHSKIAVDEEEKEKQEEAPKRSLLETAVTTAACVVPVVLAALGGALR